jgi:hypothetical protein
MHVPGLQLPVRRAGRSNVVRARIGREESSASRSEPGLARGHSSTSSGVDLGRERVVARDVFVVYLHAPAGKFRRSVADDEKAIIDVYYVDDVAAV